MPEARVARQVLSYEQEGAFYGQEAPPLQKLRAVGATLVVAQPHNDQERQRMGINSRFELIPIQVSKIVTLKY
jgi:hypothetical protein